MNIREKLMRQGYQKRSYGTHRGQRYELWSNGADVAAVALGAFARRKGKWCRLKEFLAACWRWNRLQSEGPSHEIR